jgi:uncharacterized protein YodC (DUF2158 family)
MNDFKIGDIVRHKASRDYGPFMTVYSATPEKVVCTYWHRTEFTFKNCSFHPAEIEPAGG